MTANLESLLPILAGQDELDFANGATACFRGMRWEEAQLATKAALEELAEWRHAWNMNEIVPHDQSDWTAPHEDVKHP